MTFAGLAPLILLMLMGDRKPKAPPAWPGQRTRPHGDHPRGRTIPRRWPKPPEGHLPGFIPPDLLTSAHPILTAMPVGPGVPIRPPIARRPMPPSAPARPAPAPDRPIDHLPIRSPGQPIPHKTPPPGWGLPPGLVPPPGMMHPSEPHQPDEEHMPEVVISPIETEPAAPEPAPHEDEDEPEKIVIVRKGEGLSQVAQRLGQPGGLASVRELRAANVPHGPHNDWETTKSGNLTIPGQPNRGLQPGDTLFVPLDWL